MLNRSNLHTYQVRAVQILRENDKAYLMIAMGLGKTVATLTAIADILESGEAIKVIVIAPKRVAEKVWSDEIKKWAHVRDLRLSVIAGTPKERRAAMQSDAQVHVIGRDLLPWLVETKTNFDYDTLVVDEADSFQNPSSKRFKFLKRVRGMFKRVWLLSGTPGDALALWPQYFLLDGGQRLGKTMSAYKDRFFEADYMGWTFKLRAGAEAQIHAAIEDITVSMRAEDYLTMPDRIDSVIKVSLTAAARTAYKRMERDYLLPYADTEITAANAAVLAGKLLQLANGAVYDADRNIVQVHDEKLNALSDLIERADGPVMVMYLFKHDLARISTFWPAARELKTGTDIDDWNEGKVPILLAHPASCGHGLNLQGAAGSCQVWYGLPWSLGLYQQACARIHRQGVKHTVVIHHLITQDSIDEDVMQTLADKGAGQERLLKALQRRYMAAF